MNRSQELFAAACKYIPGGVNSPVRAFRAVGSDPLFIERAKGPYVYDVDGQRYIDYVGSWGPMIAGHANAHVLEAVREVALEGLSFGAPTAAEVRMAERVCELMPSIELVRMTNSGTEAAMSAIRLARGYTGRERIVKFEGCYHGHGDALLVKAGSGALTLGVPSSPGVPSSVVEDTVTLNYNDIPQVQEFFAAEGETVACVMVEPVAGNMNCIPPVPGFLECLREVCDRNGSVLVFDEVMTGFRVALGGAQALYDVQPDMTTLGKIIGGGMPVGAFGGKREIMEYIAPLGPVYQAGTLSGNPVAMAAGLATLEIVSAEGFHEQLAENTHALVQGIAGAAEAAGIPMAVNQAGGMFGLFFTDAKTVTNYQQATACDDESFTRFFHGMLAEGVYLAPSAFEAGFVSSAHTQEHIDATIAAATKVLRDIA